METSILTSVKKVLGIDVDYEVFDEDIIMHINTAFSTLNQLGLGPEDGFTIQDDSAVWDSFSTTEPAIKTYVYLRVRIIFDPPATSYVLAAYENQLEQLEWRMNTRREGTEWVDPDPEPIGVDDCG